jgi:hypothetical protein
VRKVALLPLVDCYSTIMSPHDYSNTQKTTPAVLVDELSKIRILDASVFDESERLRDDCKAFLGGTFDR